MALALALALSESNYVVRSHVTRPNISDITVRYRIHFPYWYYDFEINWRKSCKSWFSTKIFTFGSGVLASICKSVWSLSCVDDRIP